jgi:membrane fusion protein
MSSDPQSLFRQEVLAARSDTSSGAAIIIRPVGANTLTAFFVILAAMVVGVLVFGSYTKKERVAGLVQARDGVATITPTEAGLLKQVFVKEGQTVRKGDVIAEISSERFSDAGNTSALLETNLASQRDKVASQAQGQEQANQAMLASLEQRITQGERDLTSLAEEIRLIGLQVASTRKLLEQLKPLLAERIVSELEYEQSNQTLLEQTARQQTQQRQRNALIAEIAQARQERARLVAQNQVTQASLQRDMLNLQQESVQRRLSSATLLKAPFDGVVSGLMATPGQTVAAGASLGSIVPSASPMEAVLYVPSTAMGFIKPGQGVRVAYDAFPYQRFGQYRGKVSTVSQTDIPVSASTQDRRAIFMVRVALDQPFVKAYGTQVPLRPGHTLTADIEIDRRSLMRWMLDPLFAFSGKL